MENKKKGFTIVELVIVIAVIAVLASVLVPTFSVVIEKAKYSSAYQECVNKYKQDTLEQSLAGKSTIEDYYFTYENNGYYFTNGNNTLKNINKQEYDKILFQKDSLNWNGKIISILGDSISTFEGYNPVADGINLDHRVRYSHSAAKWYFDNGGTADDTYWMKLIKENGGTLGINDS